jgi:hypothetical protein
MKHFVFFVIGLMTQLFDRYVLSIPDIVYIPILIVCIVGMIATMINCRKVKN